MNQQHQMTDRTIDRGFVRFGAVSGMLGVVAALVQAGIDPSYGDDATEAVRQASLSHLLTFSRVLDVIAFLLLLVGVSTISSVFATGRGAGWARLARTVYTVSATAGATATMIVGTFPDIARSWADATPATRSAYVAVYDALDNVSGGIFTVSWAALGFFGIVFALAVLRDARFPKLLAAVSLASGASLIGAIVVGVGLQIDAAFLLLVLGLLLSYVVVVFSALRVLRLTRRSADEPSTVRAPVG